MKAESIVSLLKICVENTYFMCLDRIFIQINGLAIGANTSGFAADIFMYNLEKKALGTFISPPNIWLRYVDDTFARLKIEHVETFMNHLNTQHTRIQFTSEALIENKLAFLDVEVNVTEDRRIKLKVYKKPTHTDQYLMFSSNHHIGQKLGIVSTLKHRIETIVTTTEDKEEEEEGMKLALKECGYPQWAVDRKKKKKEKREDQSRGKVILPYVKTVSEKIAKVLRKYNVEVIHKPTKKLKGYVCNMKSKIDPMDRVGAVYEVECKRHKDDYTGETDRALKYRGYEHKVITHKESERCHTIKGKEKNNIEGQGNQETRKSARNTKKKDYKKMDSGSDIIMNEGNTEVSKHMAHLEHEEGDVTIKALTFDENWYTRGIREAIEIKRRKPTLNADEGRYHLCSIYDNVIEKKKEVAKQTENPT